MAVALGGAVQQLFECSAAVDDSRRPGGSAERSEADGRRLGNSANGCRSPGQSGAGVWGCPPVARLSSPAISGRSGGLSGGRGTAPLAYFTALLTIHQPEAAVWWTSATTCSRGGSSDQSVGYVLWEPLRCRRETSPVNEQGSLLQDETHETSRLVGDQRTSSPGQFRCHTRCRGQAPCPTEPGPRTSAEARDTYLHGRRRRRGVVVRERMSARCLMAAKRRRSMRVCSTKVRGSDGRI